jgi:hypothetical protein
MELGIPKIFHRLFHLVSALEAVKASGAMPEREGIPVLRTAQIMRYSGVIAGIDPQTGIPYHGNLVCWPQGGLIVLYLRASHPWLTRRGVLFRKSGTGSAEHGFFMQVGGLYVMGAAVFGRNKGWQHAAVGEMPAGDKYEYEVVLLRYDMVMPALLAAEEEAKTA